MNPAFGTKSGLPVQVLIDTSGNSFNPNVDWQQCSAENPCLIVSKMFDALQLRPITPQPGTIYSTPYVQINLGGLGFASNGPKADGHDCDPITSLNWDGIIHDIIDLNPNPNP